MCIWQLIDFVNLPLGMGRFHEIDPINVQANFLLRERLPLRQYCRPNTTYLLSWSIFRSIVASRSFMVFRVAAKSWSVSPSALGRLAPVGVFGIDTSDLLIKSGRGVGICVCMPRFADCIRCCELLEYCQRLRNAYSSS